MSVYTHILPVEYTPYLEESVPQDHLSDIYYLPSGKVRPAIVPSVVNIFLTFSSSISARKQTKGLIPATSASTPIGDPGSLLDTTTL